MGDIYDKLRGYLGNLTSNEDEKKKKLERLPMPTVEMRPLSRQPRYDVQSSPRPGVTRLETSQPVSEAEQQRLDALKARRGAQK